MTTHGDQLEPWRHEHTFGQDERRSAEGRTVAVVVLTGVTMVVEIAAGVLFGSMALLADGLHMASHTAALAINAFAYRFARAHASNRRFTFGTGKVNALGGFTGAVLLATFAAIMAWESLQRFFTPAEIAYDQAIAVAIVGLLVNGLSVFVLGEWRAAKPAHEGHVHAHGHDHNLRSAYLHVLADALTSVLAIGALLSAKYFGLVWMDPAVGLLGGFLVARWSYGLLVGAGSVLLDVQAPDEVCSAIERAIESDGDSRVTDLHVWAIGQGAYAAVVSVVADEPREPSEYRDRLPAGHGLAHVSIEVGPRP